MRKFLSLITTACLALSMLAGCQSNSVEGSSTTVNQSTNSNNLKVVSTIFPLYDWTKEITDGGNIDLTLLVDNGVDLHSYQVTTEDIMSIKTADVVIYLGSSSDSWVEDALAENANPNVVVINALELIGQENLLEGDHVHDETCEHDSEEEHVHDETCDHDHEEEHVHDETCDHDHEEEHVHDETCEHDHEEEHECDETCDHDHEVDEHIWLSITNAIKVCQEISNIFAGIDTENKANFELNFENYKVELLQLDTLYKEVVAEAKSDTLIFGDRFPFAYFVKDYNLNYFSAFSSCTAETEASFETILLLTEKINELNVSAVLTIENPQHKIAETLVENSNYKDTQILVLHSLQGITTAEINNGLTYLSVMTENLEVIKEALN